MRERTEGWGILLALFQCGDKRHSLSNCGSRAGDALHFSSLCLYGGRGPHIRCQCSLTQLFLSAGTPLSFSKCGGRELSYAVREWVTPLSQCGGRGPHSVLLRCGRPHWEPTFFFYCEDRKPQFSLCVGQSLSHRISQSCNSRKPRCTCSQRKVEDPAVCV